MANRVAAKPVPKKKPARVGVPEASALLYLYGISGKGRAERPLRAEGIDGLAKVEAHGAGEVIAWVSRVGSREFGEGLEQKMQDLEWLATASVRHQRVVAEISARADVLPARFGTMFSSATSLERHLREQAAAIRKNLQRVRGAEEWGVKIFAEPQRAAATVSATSGRDYLQKKSEALQTRTQRALPAAAKDLERDLKKLVMETAPVGKVSGGQRDLVWQRSVLLQREKRGDFQRLLKKYAQRLGEEFRLEASGPWPPYSFVSHGR